MEHLLTPPPIERTEHAEFDQMCSQVEEFEPLPSVTARSLEPADPESEEESSLDGQILAGLVSP
jgi:hypothetical protein